MSEPTPLFRCGGCGAPGRIRVVEWDGNPRAARISACDACLEETLEHLAAVRPVFEAMVAAGIDRGLANDAMTDLLARLDAAKAWPLEPVRC